MEGLVVHPAQHEHLTGVVLLNDGRDESVIVTLEERSDGGIEFRHRVILPSGPVQARMGP